LSEGIQHQVEWTRANYDLIAESIAKHEEHMKKFA